MPVDWYDLAFAAICAPNWKDTLQLTCVVYSENASAHSRTGLPRGCI